MPISSHPKWKIGFFSNPAQRSTVPSASMHYLKFVSAGEPVLECNCYRDKWSGGLGVSTVSTLTVASPSLIRASGVVICATRTAGLSLSQQRTVSVYCMSDSNQGEKGNPISTLCCRQVLAHHHRGVSWSQRGAETQLQRHPRPLTKLKSRIESYGARYNQ